MKSYFAITFLALLNLFVSCKEADEVIGENNSNEPISFIVGTGDLTRASRLTSMPEFTVYAYDGNGNVIINGGKFNSDGTSKDGSVYYWPLTGNVTFYAYAPDNSSYLTWNETDKTLIYNADADANNQQDVIYATTTQSRTTDGKVSLTFKHANAGLAVKWNTASDLPSNINVSVSEIKICNLLQTGTLTFNKNMSASGNKNVYDLGLNGLMMVSPQSITTWNSNPNHPEKIENTTKAYMSIKCRVKVDSKYLVGSDSEDGTLYYPITASNIGANTITTLSLALGAKRFDATRVFGYDSNGKAVRYVPPYVDLGLSVKWATCNLDADYPEESGKYYAFGSTIGYENGTHLWSLDTAPYHIKGKGEGYGTSPDELSKYKNIYETLESSDDAATANLGINYRTPSPSEIDELAEKCTVKWAYDYSRPGLIVTGPNGNSIFLPMFGYDHLSLFVNNEKEFGYFMSNTLTYTLKYVQGMKYSVVNASMSYHKANLEREEGWVIRPVYQEVPSINIGTDTTIPENSQAKGYTIK